MTPLPAPTLELLRDSEEALRLVLRCLEDLGLDAPGLAAGGALRMHLSLGLLDVGYQLEAYADDASED